MHQTLLADRVRTLAYQEAIEAGVRPGDVVLDLGCGSGILSLMAARSGCRKVYAVDRSRAMIEQAREAARRNGLDARIEFVRARFADLELPEKVDVIVHELIGGRFWDEEMLAAVARARKRHLKRGGRLLPQRLDVLVAPTSHVSDFKRSLGFWAKQHYGFDLGSFGRLAFQQGIRQALLPQNIHLRDSASFLAPPKTVLRLDLRTATRLAEELKTSFQLKPGRRLGGLCAFLRVRLDARRGFSTGPQLPGTHWGQVFLPAAEVQTIESAARLDVTLTMATEARDWRWTLDLSPSSRRAPGSGRASPARP
jgi:protein arginine N-methyltransferase 1